MTEHCVPTLFPRLQETEDKDLGVSDKFNLVLQVARKVQVRGGLVGPTVVVVMVVCACVCVCMCVSLCEYVHMEGQNWEFFEEKFMFRNAKSRAAKSISMDQFN